LSKISLERRDERPTDKSRALDDISNRGIDLAFDRKILRMKIEKLNHGTFWIFRAGLPAWMPGSIMSDVTTGSDDGALANANRQDGGVRTNRDFVADVGWFPQRLVTLRRVAVAETVVDEHDAMTDKTVLADGYELTHESMRLDAVARADHRPLLDLHKLSDKHVIAKPAAVKIAGLGYDDPRSEYDVFDTRPANVRGHLAPPNIV
jgi:hypothetical protein